MPPPLAPDFVAALRAAVAEVFPTAGPGWPLPEMDIFLRKPSSAPAPAATDPPDPRVVELVDRLVREAGGGVVRTVPRLVEQVGRLARDAEEHVVRVARVVRGYHAHLGRLGVPLDGVAAYVRAERAVLADLYRAVREPVPSPARVRSLVVRYAVDARRPADPPLERFTWRGPRDAVELGERPPGLLRSGVLAAYRPVPHPFAGTLLLAAEPRLQARAIVGLIEGLFGGPIPAEEGESPAGSVYVSSPEPDGLFEPCGFRWRGKAADFRGASLQFCLVSALWDGESPRHRPVRLETDLVDELYRGKEKPDPALKNLIQQVRSRFASAGLALTVARRRGRVWLEERPA